MGNREMNCRNLTEGVMMKAVRPIPASSAIAAIALTLCGCDRSGDRGRDAKPLSEQIDTLRAEVASLSLAMEGERSASKDLAQIRDAVEDIEYRMAAETFVTLRPNSEGYAPIKTALGHLVLSMESASANANGTTVLIAVGNPLNCDLRKVEMTVRYGEIDAKGEPVQETAKTKQIKLSKTLRRGSWTDVRVGLDDIKPADFGFISIGNVYHSTIILAE